MALRLSLALMLVLSFVGCDQTEGECVPMTAVDQLGNPTPRDADGNAIWPNPDGLRLGSMCTKNSECSYNWCYLGSSVTGSDKTKGFCSRRCSCGEDCADEGYFPGSETEALFACQRPSASSGSTDVEKAFCVPRCEALGDCAEYAAEYTACKMPATGAPKKLCQIQ